MLYFIRDNGVVVAAIVVEYVKYVRVVLFLLTSWCACCMLSIWLLCHALVSIDGQWMVMSLFGVGWLVNITTGIPVSIAVILILRSLSQIGS